MKKICALLMALLLSLSAGCGTIDPDEAQESIQVIAMDTAMIFTAYGVNSTKADYAAEEEVYRLEAMLSRTDEESQVARLNSQGTADIDAELWGLIETAMAYSEATGGAFDITVAPVLLAWGWGGAYPLPGGEYRRHRHRGTGPGHPDRSGRYRQGLRLRPGGGHF